MRSPCVTSGSARQSILYSRPAPRGRPSYDAMTAPTPPGAQALNLRVLLEEVIERGASDLHITAGERPMLRIDGDMRQAAIKFEEHPTELQSLAYTVRPR